MKRFSFAEDVRQNAGRTVRSISRHPDLVAVMLIGLGVLRILATLTVFSATADEANHVSAGLQLLTEHRYNWHLENPPLPRLVLAYPLYRIAGDVFDESAGFFQQLRTLFYASGHYQRDLFMARVGNLLFFILAALGTWRWARRELGPSGAAMTTLLFTTQPVVLGYSGIANLDAAGTAGLAIAILAFSRWMERQSAGRAIIAGAAYGLACGLKFSNIVFVPAVCLAIYIGRLIRDPPARQTLRRLLAHLPLIAIGTFLLTWASYGFAFGTFDDYGLARPGPETIVGRMLVPVDPAKPIPAPHFPAGVAGLMRIDNEGNRSYFFGEARMDGFRLYFPVAVALKTTLGSLVLVLAGFRFAGHRALFLGAMLAVVAILVSTAPSTLNLGVRFVLPLYIPLSAAAAVAAMTMLAHAKKGVRIAAIVLLVWHTSASVLAHPDYFPYFNELALPDPSRYLADSNLDWGQDVLRLRDVARDEKMESLGVHVMGTHDYDALGFPPTHHVDAVTPTQGWVAVSDHAYRLSSGAGWSWLRERPYRRVGKSIRLYYIP